MMVTCAGCEKRFRLDDVDPWGEAPRCASCTMAEDAGTALEFLERGNVSEALAAIEDGISYPPAVTPDLVIENLIYDAGDCVRRCDLDEAAIRLRLAAHPKWSSLKECKEQYQAAMGR